jgi:hypothetical protein
MGAGEDPVVAAFKKSLAVPGLSRRVRAGNWTFFKNSTVL